MTVKSDWFIIIYIYLCFLVIIFVNVHLIDSHRQCGIVRRFVQKVHAQFDQEFVKRWNPIRIQNIGLYEI